MDAIHTHEVVLRVTPEQKAQVINMTRKYDVTPSMFFRMMLRENFGPPSGDDLLLGKQLRKDYQETRGAANVRRKRKAA